MKTTGATSNDFFETPRPVIDNYHLDGPAIPMPIDLKASQVRINKLLDKRYILVDYSEVGKVPMLKPWQIRIDHILGTIQESLGPIGDQLSIRIAMLREKIELTIIEAQESEKTISGHHSTPYGIDETGSEKIRYISRNRDKKILDLVQELLCYIDQQPSFLKQSMDTIKKDLQWLVPISK